MLRALDVDPNVREGTFELVRLRDAPPDDPNPNEQSDSVLEPPAPPGPKPPPSAEREKTAKPLPCFWVHILCAGSSGSANPHSRPHRPGGGISKNLESGVGAGAAVLA